MVSGSDISRDLVSGCWFARVSVGCLSYHA